MENAFLTTSGERLLITTRQHWIALIWPLVVTVLVASALIILTAFAFLWTIHSPTMFISITLLIVLVGLNLATKLIIDWYFHLYVITNRKIIKAQYSPLFSHVVNEIMLDQVRCTEIDIQMGGFINELIDVGNVEITFDRPTHQEEFVLSNIKNPKKVGIFLGDMLDIMKRQPAETSWFRTKDKQQGFRFIEEIFPHNTARIGEPAI